MVDFLHYALILVGGLAFDWALFEGFSLSLSVISKRHRLLSYSEAIFPRVIVTVVALFFVARGTTEEGVTDSYFFLGLMLFLVSVVYAQTQRSN
jgi:hypothetical protein